MLAVNTRRQGGKLRRRQWTPTVGDVVRSKEHHLSKAAEALAAINPRHLQGYYGATLKEQRNTRTT